MLNVTFSGLQTISSGNQRSFWFIVIMKRLSKLALSYDVFQNTQLSMGKDTAMRKYTTVLVHIVFAQQRFLVADMCMVGLIGKQIFFFFFLQVAQSKYVMRSKFSASN